MDSGNCFIDINAGSGGTEAQDWASMLLRMYMRYAERKGYTVELLEESAGEVAGIKSASVKVSGEYAYGHLRTETGVHRLVRKSPFDSGNRRHTSFASVFVYPEVDDSIEIEINPADLRIDTFRASGAGGQHINKTDSAVRMTHLPTGIVVQCQNDRSQHRNRDEAWNMLRARIYEAEILRINVRGAENVVQACVRANVDRIVLTSSVAALGGTSDPSVLSEKSCSTKAVDAVAYSRSKLEAEVAARARCRPSTKLTIMRPSVLLGPNDFSHSSAASFVLPVLTGEMPVVVRGGSSFGDVRDAALAHVAALEMSDPAPAYLLGGHNLTIAEIGKFVAERGGVRAPVRIPRRVAFVAAAVAERVSKILGREPVLTKDLIRASAAFTFVDSSLAVTELGYRIRPLNESVLDTIAFFLQTKMLDSHNATLRALSGRSWANL